MVGDLIDLLVDYEPDFGARGNVRFVPTEDLPTTSEGSL